jgi:MraZ protein
VLLTGQYEHTIDAKGRVAIPADIRSRWEPQRDGGAWYAVPWVGGIIRLYSETTFQKRASELPSSFVQGENADDLQATLFGLAARLEPDNAGRVRLPDQQTSLTGLSSEVMIVGAGDRLEIHDRAAWKESCAKRLSELPNLMSRLSEQMKPAS